MRVSPLWQVSVYAVPNEIDEKMHTEVELVIQLQLFSWWILGNSSLTKFYLPQYMISSPYFADKGFSTLYSLKKNSSIDMRC
jgi:hypothetical protein